MLRVLIVVFLLGLSVGCAVHQSVSLRESEEEAADSTEYELIVFDSGFESWYLSQARPLGYRDQSYYEQWNRLYVQSWNQGNTGSRYARLLEGIINYEPDVDYGPEINHKLFYYFIYVEQVLKIPVLSNGPSLF
ncbi:MAG: DUF6146 family protein [Mangrovibacterium sp.]